MDTCMPIFQPGTNSSISAFIHLKQLGINKLTKICMKIVVRYETELVFTSQNFTQFTDSFNDGFKDILSQYQRQQQTFRQVSY